MSDSVFITTNRRKIEITHPDKILFPKSKISKKEIANYYQKVARRMIPHMKDRPVSMQRYPNGIHKESFFQKNISSFFPKWIKTASVKRKGASSIKMVLCNNVATLVYLANLASLTPHIWLSKIDKPGYPDRMIFDLDPMGLPFSEVAIAARALKKILLQFHLHCFLMTTGSKGLHLIVPIKRLYTFDQVRSCARKLAQMLVEEDPKRYTINPRKEKRRKKILIDYLRNGYAQTVVAPYSLRAIEGASIATPIDFKELTRIKNAQAFTIKNIFPRLAKKKDPWSQMAKKQSSLPISLPGPK